jgi:FlaA1/EpsC-like NDP-sugar epimerase
MAGLMLCGTLYLVPGYLMPRAIVIMAVILALVISMLRRAGWRHMIKRHYLGGLGTRNILIVGAGQRAEALRTQLDTLHRTGVQFKGFISSLPHEDLALHPDVVANLDDCVVVARSFLSMRYTSRHLSTGLR